MELLLNDVSICGQFEDDEFYKYMQMEMIPILCLAEKTGCILYKDYGTYMCFITSKKNFRDFMRIQGDPIIDKLRLYLIKLSDNKPFWNDQIKTRSNVKYDCAIKELPNCISEAYERKGIVLSFLCEDYKSNFLTIFVDGKEKKVPNACLKSQLESHLENAGLLNVWTKNSFIIEQFGVKFEVRFSEQHHKIPHFHLSNSDFNVSISIPDADILVGEIPVSMKSKIISWSLCNMSQICSLWNKYHKDNMVEEDNGV